MNTHTKPKLKRWRHAPGGWLCIGNGFWETGTTLRLAYLAWAAWLLAGCAALGPPPIPEPTVTSGVTALPPQLVPVTTPCLTKDKIPPPPPTWFRMTQSGFQLQTAGALDIAEMKDYLITTQSLLWGCIKDLEATK